jgi:hypothetical protein
MVGMLFLENLLLLIVMDERFDDRLKLPFHHPVKVLVVKPIR